MSTPTDDCIVLLSGPVAAGKTTLANMLATRHHFKVLSSRAAILRRLPDTLPARGDLQLAGENLDVATDGRWICEEVSSLVEESTGPIRIVVDAVLIRNQIDAVRERAAQPVFTVHVTAPLGVLESRYASKESQLAESARYATVRQNSTEAQVERLAQSADLVIDTGSITADEGVRMVLELIELKR